MHYEKNIFLAIQRLYSGMDMGLQFPESQTPAPAAENGCYRAASETPPEHPCYPVTQSCCLMELTAGVWGFFVCVFHP